MSSDTAVSTPPWIPPRIPGANLVHVVTAGFVVTVALLSLAAGLGYYGIEGIHTEVTQSIHDYLGHHTAHDQLENLIAEQSRRLLDLIEIVLGLCFVTAIICGLITLRAARTAFRELHLQAEELSLLSWRLVQEQEVTARRLSHEIHDEFGQMLIGLRMLVRQTDADNLETHRKECIALIDEAMENVRELSQLLRPVVLDDFGLSEALGWISRRMEDRAHIQITYTSRFTDRLPDGLETQLFRVAQEALANTARHAEATAVSVELFERDQEIYLKIRDNGRGFLPVKKLSARERTGMGLVGMRARMRQVGGNLEIESSPGRGVTILASAPIRATASMLLEGNDEL